MYGIFQLRLDDRYELGRVAGEEGFDSSHHGALGSHCLAYLGMREGTESELYNKRVRELESWRNGDGNRRCVVHGSLLNGCDNTSILLATTQ